MIDDNSIINTNLMSNNIQSNRSAGDNTIRNLLNQVNDYFYFFAFDRSVSMTKKNATTAIG